MDVKTYLPDSFEKEEKDEKEWEALVAPMMTILKILSIAKGIILLLGFLLCFLLAVLSNGATENIVAGVVTLVLIFGGLILMCYIGELRCNAQINHLAVEYQQRNLLKRIAERDDAHGKKGKEAE